MSRCRPLGSRSAARSPVDAKQNLNPARTLDHSLSRIVWPPSFDEADLRTVRIRRPVTVIGVARPFQQPVPRVVEYPKGTAGQQLLDLRRPPAGRHEGEVVDENRVTRPIVHPDSVGLSAEDEAEADLVPRPSHAGVRGLCLHQGKAQPVAVR